MYSRVTLLEIDTTRIALDDAVALYRTQVVPDLAEQGGYEGSLVLTTPEGKAVLITLWESEAAAIAAEPFAAGELERHTMLFATPPGREQYEVSYLDLPAVPVT
jgi:hypothetical protein